MMSPQVLDAGPRGASNLEAMSVLSTGKKGKICFFQGDDAGTSIGSHDVYGFDGKTQDVGMVQTWNQCEQMLLTSNDNPHSIMLMETETGQTTAELSLRRRNGRAHSTAAARTAAALETPLQQRNWKLQVDSITPMQKFEQYKQSKEFQLFGIGDNGHTVFSMSHDARAGKNVEEFVISADSSRKYKSYTFTCHAQTKGGYLVLGRTDGGVALYDAIMHNENASCVIDGYPGPVNSIDVAADGSMIAWTTPNWVFFTCPSQQNWEKGHKEPKPKVLKLCIHPEDQTKHKDSLASEDETKARGFWQPVKFDAATAKDEDGLMEREIISYSGKVQLRWNVRKAKAAWQALNDEEPGAPAVFFGAAHVLENNVFRHMTVMDDLDIVALEGEIVRSLHF